MFKHIKSGNDYICQGDYALSVVPQQDYSKTTDPIFLKPGGRAGYEPNKNPSNLI